MSSARDRAKAWLDKNRDLVVEGRDDAIINSLTFMLRTDRGEFARLIEDIERERV